MALLSPEQRVKSHWTTLLQKQLAIDWEKNIEDRRHEFQRACDKYAVPIVRAVNHLLPQLRKERKNCRTWTNCLWVLYIQSNRDTVLVLT